MLVLQVALAMAWYPLFGSCLVSRVPLPRCQTLHSKALLFLCRHFSTNTHGPALCGSLVPYAPVCLHLNSPSIRAGSSHGLAGWLPSKEGGETVGVGAVTSCLASCMGAGVLEITWVLRGLLAAGQSCSALSWDVPTNPPTQVLFSAAFFALQMKLTSAFGAFLDPVADKIMWVHLYEVIKKSCAGLAWELHT